MTPDDLRAGFIRFFADRGHEVCKSDRLIPENDPTLLFTPAGMNQFKEMFLGKGRLSFKRAVSSQKCMRMPDLDNVGKTASHHTFFEMLGNFSFGDYFKREAIAWSLEYLVGELGLDFKDLVVSVYLDDDESAEIWRRELEVPADKIYRFGEKDNFWPSEAPSKGPNGVCGPCSEIYVDLKGGCGRPGCSPACDCGRYVEVWNLVFTQFNRLDGGVLEPLPFKNIDTGMGFERLLRVLEGAPTNFDTPLFQPIIRQVCDLSGRSYGEDPMDDIRMRRIADHLRASVFCIADGAPPSNEKQGYVVRKVLRRAIMDGRNLGLKDSFLVSLVPSVADIMGKAYPELVEHRARIEREIAREEEKFAETYQQGSARLETMMEEMIRDHRNELSGQAAFLLYDTFGFPLDLAQRTLSERGFTVDLDGFTREMEAQRARARKGSKISGKVFDLGPLGAVRAETPPSRFVGYDKDRTTCTVLHILTEDGLVDSLEEGQAASLVLDETPFYPEGGGQVGDLGLIESDHFRFFVDQGTARDGDLILHSGVLAEGSLAKGSRAVASIDGKKRRPTERNHTATHLLHAALRKILGSHVEQAGSLVDPSRLRFDFNHPSALKREEMEKVQAEVNRAIRSDLAVFHEVKPLEAARKEGAMALFGEKYGDEVRVVAVGEEEGRCSIELCGGTHVRRTGEIGGFRILAEESIAAGTRRIEAATGEELEQLLGRSLGVLRDACLMLKVKEEDLVGHIQGLQDQIKELRKELRKHHAAQAGQVIDGILDQGVEVPGPAMLFSGQLQNIPVEELRNICDSIQAKCRMPSGVVLTSVEKGRVHIVAGIREELQKKGLHAGEICRTLGKALGGGGGGRPGMAQGQGQNADGAETALKGLVADLVEKCSRSP